MTGGEQQHTDSVWDGLRSSSAGSQPVSLDDQGKHENPSSTRRTSLNLRESLQAGDIRIVALVVSLRFDLGTS